MGEYRPLLFPNTDEETTILGWSHLEFSGYAADVGANVNVRVVSSARDQGAYSALLVTSSGTS